MGKLVDLADRATPGREGSSRHQHLGGAAVAVALPAAVYVLTKQSLRLLPRPLAAAAEAAVISSVLATRSLYEHAGRVEDGLTQDLEAGSRAVAHMVGRDTDGLDGDGVIRAAVESVAENANDGVIAPLFYGLIGGAPLALAYKMVNTLDSMIGYRNERYRYFGWLAARLDDAAGFLPARLTALSAVVLSPLVGGSPGGALAVWRRDAGRHNSPNAGVCESAYAGALGVRLGGACSYSGVWEHKPEMGREYGKPKAGDIGRAARLMFASAGLVLTAGSLARMTIAGVKFHSRGRDG